MAYEARLEPTLGWYVADVQPDRAERVVALYYRTAKEAQTEVERLERTEMFWKVDFSSDEYDTNVTFSNIQADSAWQAEARARLLLVTGQWRCVGTDRVGV